MTKTEAQQFYQRTLAQVDHLDQTGAAYALKLLADLRDYVQEEMVRSDWEAHRATQLLSGIRRATDDFRERYWGKLQDWQRTAFGLGFSIPQTFDAGISWSGIWREGFEAYAANGLHFVSDLSDDMRKALSREVLLATTGAQTPQMAMQFVRDYLGGGRAAEARAQAIVTTEVGRNFSMANYLGLKQAQEVVPELLKMWLHTGGGKTSRPEHVGMNGATLPMDEPFQFSGGPLQYPQDPDGDAGETINCH